MCVWGGGCVERGFVPADVGHEGVGALRRLGHEADARTEPLGDGAQAGNRTPAPSTHPSAPARRHANGPADTQRAAANWHAAARAAPAAAHHPSTSADAAHSLPRCPVQMVLVLPLPRKRKSPGAHNRPAQEGRGGETRIRRRARRKSETSGSDEQGIGLSEPLTLNKQGIGTPVNPTACPGLFAARVWGDAKSSPSSNTVAARTAPYQTSPANSISDLAVSPHSISSMQGQLAVSSGWAQAPSAHRPCIPSFGPASLDRENQTYQFPSLSHRTTTAAAAPGPGQRQRHRDFVQTPCTGPLLVTG